MKLKQIVLSLAHTDYPDYNSRIYTYGTEVKYEEGDEQKYRPQEHERVHENNVQGYRTADDEYDDRGY